MRTLSLLFIAACLLAGCSDEAATETEKAFDRGPLLENLADNVVVPAYRSLADETASLTTACEAFTAEPTAETLQALKAQWLSARLAWKTCEAFTFGPIDARFLDTKMDLFPVSAIGLEKAISEYDGEADYLEKIGSDRRGFGAIEYLLYHQDETATLSTFENGGYRAYLGLLSEDLQKIARTVLADWEDGYAASFKANTGNDAGASITLYTNEMIELVEVVKNFKVATPLGVRTNSDPLPELVESPYANTSVALILQNLDIVEKAFTGDAGAGLDDYLDALDLADGAESLSASILESIDDCRTAAGKLGELREDVTADPERVQVLLDALQELTTLTKSDMMSQLGVIVTFSSNDGD